jgi:hypothetical protein
VKGKTILPIILMLLLALTRWPGLMPQNFSAVYAIMFCAGVYFPRRLVWWLPFLTLALTDLLLNLYYHAHYGSPIFSPELLGNYLAYAAIVWLGRQFNHRSNFFALLAGGLLGAIIFYLITNTISWFLNPFNNPEYTKTLGGWILALTKGTQGWPETWQFFRNTFTSSGLFTALFAGAMKLMEATEPEPQEEKEPEEKPQDQPQPEEAKA